MMRFCKRCPCWLCLALLFCVASPALHAQPIDLPDDITVKRFREEMQKANVLFKDEKFEESIALFSRLKAIRNANETIKKQLNWLKLDNSLAGAYLQWSLSYQRKREPLKSKEVLEKGLELLPENPTLTNRLKAVQQQIDNQNANTLYREGHNLLREKKFEEAADKFREALELRPEVAGYRNSLIDALTKSEQYDEAAVLLEQGIEELLNHPNWDDKKRIAQATRFRKIHKDVFSMSGLGEKWIAQTRQQIKDAPSSATLHNYLADLLLDTGQRQVALAHFLFAAVELGEPDFFADRVLDFPASNEDPVAQTYYRSLVYHLPTHKKSLRAVERMVQPYRQRGRRFAFSDEARHTYDEASKAAAYIASQTSLTLEQKTEAEFLRIEYHYEPLDGQPEEWAQALDELRVLSQRKELSDGIEKRISRKMAEIYTDHLNAPDKAYSILESLFSANPDSSLLQDLASTAFQMPDIPEPIALQNVLKQKKKELKKHQEEQKEEDKKRRGPRNQYNEKRQLLAYEATLAAWYYEKGEVEEANRMIDAKINEPDISQQEVAVFKNHIRRISRPLFASLQKSRNTTSSDLIEIKEDRIVSTEYTRLAKGLKAHTHQALRVSVPDALVMNPELIVKTDKRPAVTEPPAFFRPESDNTFIATWRPLIPETPSADASVLHFDMSSYWDYNPYTGDISVDIKMSDQGETENKYLCELAVVSPRPYRLEVELFRWTQLKGEPTPPPSRQKRQTLIYENQQPTTSSLGRVYSIPLNRITQRDPSDMAPSVELSITHEEKREDIKANSRRQYQLQTSSRFVQNLLMHADDTSSATLPARSVQREVYRLGGGR